jgi:hypothetical protein
MQRFVVLTVGALALLPLAARGQGGAEKEKDATKKVAGGGVLVSGWQARVDFPNRGQKVEDLRFESMGGGFHITGGPHAIYWNPANVAKGTYTVHATFAKRGDSPGHVESYGLFMGGAHLNEDNQNYLYCVVFGNGTYSVIHRYGSETHQLASRQANDAVSKSDAAGNAKDDIAWTVSADKVGCSVNGKEVFSAPKADVIGTGKLESTDGIYGLRASHNLSIHVSNFGTGAK